MFDRKEYQAAFSKVTASEETYRRVMHMTNEKKKRHATGVVSKVLIAAVLISLLAVTASASEVVRNWFVSYFSGESEEGLSQEQVEFIEENEQHIEESQTQGGWTIELRSAMSDGTKGYIMLGVTAPADINLKHIPEESKQKYYGPRNDYLPKSSDAVLTCSVGLVADINSSWQEDGDGLDNTLTYVIQVTPDATFSTGDPFGSDTKWHIHIVDLVRGFPEQELLAEGIWDFDFAFEKETTEIEMLAEPMKTHARAYLPDGTEIQAEVTMTSFVLRPFGATVYYGDASDEVDYERTSVNFTESDAGLSPWFVVMKDGSKKQLIDFNGNPVERFRHLEVELPIVLENVDYILLFDGTKLPMPELPAE